VVIESVCAVCAIAHILQLPACIPIITTSFIKVYSSVMFLSHTWSCKWLFSEKILGLTLLWVC